MNVWILPTHNAPATLANFSVIEGLPSINPERIHDTFGVVLLKLETLGHGHDTHSLDLNKSKSFRNS